MLSFSELQNYNERLVFGYINDTLVNQHRDMGDDFFHDCGEGVLAEAVGRGPDPIGAARLHMGRQDFELQMKMGEGVAHVSGQFRPLCWYGRRPARRFRRPARFAPIGRRYFHHAPQQAFFGTAAQQDRAVGRHGPERHPLARGFFPFRRPFG